MGYGLSSSRLSVDFLSSTCQRLKLISCSSNMRMWMVNPKMLCKLHLGGEHFEIHKHRHGFMKGWSIAGRKGQIDPSQMATRHAQLALEMVSRGMRHQSPYEQPDLSLYDLEGFTVDMDESLEELCRRCPECRKRILGFSQQSCNVVV